MSNIGRVITDFYCNGFFGRVYDLDDSRIEAEGHDWVVIRKPDGRPDFAAFDDPEEKAQRIGEWCRVRR